MNITELIELIRSATKKFEITRGNMADGLEDMADSILALEEDVSSLSEIADQLDEWFNTSSDIEMDPDIAIDTSVGSQIRKLMLTSDASLTFTGVAPSECVIVLVPDGNQLLYENAQADGLPDRNNTSILRVISLEEGYYVTTEMMTI